MRGKIFAGFCVALAAVACGGESKVSPTVESPAIMVAPNLVTLAVGGADTLTYLVIGVGRAGDVTADWSASDTTVVQLSTLASHQVSVVGRKPGSASVVATWRADPSVAAAAAVTVR